MNKKLIFIVGSPRSGTTLLLSYLCGLKNTNILYETKCLTNPLNFSPTNLIEYLASIFDSIQEEIVIEKTPEHVHYLDIIEQLRKICKRDIHVIYVTRPPVPTILSILSAKKVLEVVDILGACEKYEESLVSIYHNLISKEHETNLSLVKRHVYGKDIEDKLIKVSCYHQSILVPYFFHVTYRGLTEDSYFTLYSLLVNELHLDLSDSEIRGLVVNRKSNLTKVLPQVLYEKHHSNLFKELDVVNKERLSNVGSLVNEHKEEIRYITNYFNKSDKRANIYDLVTKRQVVEVEENPLVTIIVPLYNKEKYVEETLSSLLNQTYKNVRVVVVYDDSTDNSLEVVRDYVSTLPPELQDKVSDLYLEKNKGVAYARNIGLNSVKAHMSYVITFCDADDIWDSTLVEKSVATFKKYPYVDCVYSRVLLLTEDGELTKNHSKICNGHVYEDSLEYNFLTCGSNIFVKASVIEEHNIRFNEEYKGCEDWDFLIQLAKVATFKCTKEYLVKYRQLPNSLSTNKELQVTNGKKILDKYVVETKRFKRIFTRLFLYYFSVKNIKLEHIKDLDFRFILRVVVSKLKSFVKSHIS